jgi:hypothetical protein
MMSGRPVNFVVSGVAVSPGQTAFTRTPSRAWSIAMFRVRFTTPPLAAL